MVEDQITALGAVISAFAAVGAAWAVLHTANKQVRASLEQERLSRLRDELSRFVGNVAYLASCGAAREPERLRALFLQRASVVVCLDLSNPSHAQLESLLNDILALASAETFTSAAIPEGSQLDQMIRSAVLQFQAIRTDAATSL